MSSYKRMGRETIRGADIGQIGCPHAEQKCPELSYISKNARRVLNGITVPEGSPTFSEINKYDDPMQRSILARNLAANDGRIAYTVQDGQATITLRGEAKTPVLQGEGAKVIGTLHKKFGMPHIYCARIYETFRNDSEGICRKLAVNGYGPMLTSRSDILSKSLREVPANAEDPILSAVELTSNKYEKMISQMMKIKSTKQSRRIGTVFGMTPKYTLALAEILGHDNVQQVCRTLSHEGYTRLIGSNPEVLIASHFEAMQLMPDHDDSIEATLLVAAMNYEKLATNTSEPFVLPASTISWEEVEHDIGFTPGKRSFKVPKEDIGSSMEMNEEGEWPKTIPLFDKGEQPFDGKNLDDVITS